MKTLFKLVFTLASVCSSEVGHAQVPHEFTVTWIDRPWEYRYLLHVNGVRSWGYSKEFFAADLAKDPAKAGEYGEPLAVHYTPSFTLPLAQETPDQYLNVLRLDITRERSIVQPTLRGDHLRPRLNRLGSIVLTPSDDNPSYVVDFGFFFLGSAAAADERYSPAICSVLLGDTPPFGESGRYWKGFTPDPAEGYFGCREWAAQLYDRSRPYIDVTSYEMAPDDAVEVAAGQTPPLVAVSYIRRFVGFSRFDSPLKPVIGNHEGQWYCITDCPQGERPGPIADIKAWAERSGWAVPMKPQNVREFMDRPPDPDDFLD